MNLKCDLLVSKFAFKWVNLYRRYAEAAKGALAWNGEEWDGKFLVVRKYAPKDSYLAPKEEKPVQPDVAKVEGSRLAFVCNLSWWGA